MFRNDDEILEHISNHLSNRSFSSIEVKIKLHDGEEVKINVKGNEPKRIAGAKSTRKPTTPWLANQTHVKKLKEAPSLRS